MAEPGRRINFDGIPDDTFTGLSGGRVSHGKLLDGPDYGWVSPEAQQAYDEVIEEQKTNG